MKRISKIVSMLFLGLFLGIFLASCNEYNFYDDYKDANISEDADFKFEVITLDDAVEYKNNNKSFVLILGTSTLDKCVSAIETIYNEAEYLNYDGLFLYVSVTDLISSIKGQNEPKEKLGIYSATSTNYGVVFACFDKGVLQFDTSKPDKYEALLYKFCKGSTNVAEDISTRAVTDYIVEYYPISSLNDLK